MASVRRSEPRLRTVLWAVLASLGAAGCAPDCERVCRKVRDCDVADRLAQSECEESCTRTRLRYQDWDDKNLLEDFAAHRRCIVQATCDELEEGACYDEDLFAF